MVVGAGEAANAIIKEIVNSNFSTMVIRCINHKVQIRMFHFQFLLYIINVIFINIENNKLFRLMLLISMKLSWQCLPLPARN